MVILMYIKIGTLAKHFRISPQTIRYYEEKGFLQPTRDRNTGDRRYHLRTLKLLSSVRQYHNMGFGTREIQELFSETELDAIDARLKAQALKTEREMEELRFRLEALRRQRANILRVHDLQGRFELCALPPMYLLIDRRDDQITEDDAVWSMLEKWINALPIVESAVRVHPSSILACDPWSGRESGYCAWEQDALRLGLPIGTPAEKIEWPLCIHTAVRRAMDEPSYQGIAAYAESQGLEICAPAIQRVLSKVGEFRALGEEVIPAAVYYECWIPVTRKRNMLNPDNPLASQTV
ncbi:MAG: MerR family transcriptional regulator [Clostridia bacterium]|nr:MerR family transcriptional regulator [Clostridia bacterium]